MSGIDIASAEIDGLTYASLVVNFLVCEHCSVVDGDRARISVGHPCGACGQPSGGGGGYYPFQVVKLAHLMHAVFHATSTEPRHGIAARRSEGAHRAAALVFFGALEEVVFDHVLRRAMAARGLSRGDQQQCRRRAKGRRGRWECVFPAVFRAEWDTALRTLGNPPGTFTETAAFVRRVTTLRNRLLHDGDPWGIPEGLSRECLLNARNVLNLYACLHNAYVRDPPLPLGYSPNCG